MAGEKLDARDAGGVRQQLDRLGILLNNTNANVDALYKRFEPILAPAPPESDCKEAPAGVQSGLARELAERCDQLFQTCLLLTELLDRCDL